MSVSGVLPAAGELLELTVGEAVHGGWCVARQHPDGPVILVRHALPGERVRVAVTQSNSRLARAEAVEILAAAPERVCPPCPHARPGGCGGCDWQHASLPAQRSLKAGVIRQQLRRMAGIDREVTVEPLPGEADGLGWRTTVRFGVDRGGAAGLHRHRSHELVEVGDCPIAHRLIDAAGVGSARWPGASSVEVAVAPEDGQRLMIITGAAGAAGRAAAAAEADSVLVAAAGRAPRPVRGRGQLVRRAAGRSWRVGAGVFWQVHPGAADTLAAAVLGTLRPQAGNSVLDLYCGAGLFAGVLAEAVGPAGRVIGIERNGAAVRDARHNLRDLPWARVHRGDVAAVLAAHGGHGATLAVLDPPRTGLPRQVVDLLCAPDPGQRAPGTGLRRVAYVSCDPATLARDIAVFGSHRWRLEALRAFDAFPMTHHVECLATLVPDTSP